jgi:excisionase family DNA binding protein
MKTNGKQAEENADLVDMEEAIALLKTTRQTFYRWLRSGKFKGMKVGRQWRFYREDIDRFLKGEGPRIDLPGSLKPLLGNLERKLKEAGKAPNAPLSGSEDVQAVSLMLLLGYHLRASDLHLEPTAKEGGGTMAVLRYRIDGVLHVFAEFELPLLKPIVERWKTMGNANVHEAKKPQDCRIQMSLSGNPVDLRVSFIPACLGEAMTARFLDPNAVRLSLDNIPYSARDRDALEKAVMAPWGLVFVTGPVGSGKTTVLYACLQMRVKPQIKVMSVEDPVEYILPGVTQIQVRVAEGVTFSAALRAIMRSDPDVVMVGEIRDLETLRVAQQMALTGHLVLSTMHTQNAAQALKRMVDVGGDAFLAADATKLILAQRLLRKVCPACGRSAKPSPGSLARAVDLARAGGLKEDIAKGTFKKTQGCAECRQTGYRGRTVMAEALVMTPEIAAALQQGVPPEEIQAIAVRQGMTTMAADGIRRAAAGETTLEEVFRILPG